MSNQIHSENEVIKQNVTMCSCGCTPDFFVQMIEHAGNAMSRREFIKTAAIAGGVLVAGGPADTLLAAGGTVDPDKKADIIFHGGPILTMADAG